MCREKGREHDDVAEQEDPEPEPDDDKLGSWPPFAASGRVALSSATIASCGRATPEAIRIDVAAVALRQGFAAGTHAGSSARACVRSQACRAPRRSRSRRATSAAGMTYSSTSRHANQTKTT